MAPVRRRTAAVEATRAASGTAARARSKHSNSSISNNDDDGVDSLDYDNESWRSVGSSVYLRHASTFVALATACGSGYFTVQFLRTFFR